MSSCIMGDCLQAADGIVLDSATKKPILDVMVYKAGNVPYHTDSVGKFEARGISGGWTGCPVLVLNFSKDGYKFKSLAMDTGEIKVYLAPEQKIDTIAQTAVN